MPTFTRVPPTGNVKVEYFVEQQQHYKKKKTLLNLFTVCTRPCFSLPDDVYGAPLILMECDHLYDAMPYIQAGVFHANKYHKDIAATIGADNFSADVIGNESFTLLTTSPTEKELAKGKDTFYVTRGMDSKDTFAVGQFLRTPWDDLCIVTQVRTYRHLKEHPCIESLSESDRKRLDGLPHTVMTLTTYREGIPTSPSSDQSIYAVAMVKQPDGTAIGDDRAPAQLGLVLLSEDSTVAAYRIYDTFLLQKGMINNYTDTTSIKTTMGLFVLNAVVLAHIFGDTIPYVNSPEGTSAFTPSKIDDLVAIPLRENKVGRAEYNKYMDHGYFLGHLTQICVPGLSKKSLVTDPRVKARAKELYELHKDELDNTVVMTKIEQELIDMDKAWIRGDSSERYYAVSPKKSYNEARKKMFLTMGLAPSFVKGAASYENIQHSLSDGWHARDLTVIANEIRRGSYDRGINTAKGGEQTAFLLRLFNATRIVEDNCGTNEGIKMIFTEDLYKTYLGRYIVTAPGKYTEITPENASMYFGKEITLRSPQYCKTPKGLCFTCCGAYFRSLNAKDIGMLASMIGSKFTAITMKSMHATGVLSTTIKDLTPYLIF